MTGVIILSDLILYLKCVLIGLVLMSPGIAFVVWTFVSIHRGDKKFDRENK